MKARLTVTLDARLLAHVDRAVGKSPDLGSRSAVIEEAVRRWSRTQYEAGIRDYYATHRQLSGKSCPGGAKTVPRYQMR